MGSSAGARRGPGGGSEAVALVEASSAPTTRPAIASAGLERGGATMVVGRGHTMKVLAIRHDPKVALVEGFLTKQEAALIIRHAGSSQVEWRTSQGAVHATSGGPSAAETLHTQGDGEAAGAASGEAAGAASGEAAGRVAGMTAGEPSPRVASGEAPQKLVHVNGRTSSWCGIGTHRLLCTHQIRASPCLGSLSPSLRPGAASPTLPMSTARWLLCSPPPLSVPLT